MHFVTVPLDVTLPGGRSVSFSQITKELLARDERATENASAAEKTEQIVNGDIEEKRQPLASLKPGDVWPVLDECHALLSMIFHTSPLYKGDNTLRVDLLPFTRAIGSAPTKRPSVVPVEPATA